MQRPYALAASPFFMETDLIKAVAVTEDPNLHNTYHFCGSGTTG